jgi:RNA polymerase sigma-70 factor, ECF subfamily
MPPAPLEYQGRPAIAAFLLRLFAWAGGRRDRLVPTRANGQPAFACYSNETGSPVAQATGLIVLTLESHRVAAITRFLDVEVLAPFALPRALRD